MPYIRELTNECLMLANELIYSTEKAKRVTIVGDLCSDLVRISDMQTFTEDSLLALTEHYTALLMLCRDFNREEVPVCLLETVDDLVTEQLFWYNNLTTERRLMCLFLWVLFERVTGELANDI